MSHPHHHILARCAATMLALNTAVASELSQRAHCGLCYYDRVSRRSSIFTQRPAGASPAPTGMPLSAAALVYIYIYIYIMMCCTMYPRYPHFDIAASSISLYAKIIEAVTACCSGGGPASTGGRKAALTSKTLVRTCLLRCPAQHPGFPVTISFCITSSCKGILSTKAKAIFLLKCYVFQLS